jgi:hypothetical protein
MEDKGPPLRITPPIITLAPTMVASAPRDTYAIGCSRRMESIPMLPEKKNLVFFL